RAEVLCNTYRSLAEVAYYHRPDRKALYRAEAGLLALRLGSTSASAQALALSAFMAAQEGRFDVAEASTRRALPAAHACGDAIALMFAQSMTAAARTMSGAPAEGVASSAEAWALAQRVAEPLRMMSVASIHALGLAATGDADGASEVARTMRALGQRYGYARVRELGVVCSAAADQAGLRFEGVWEHALAADDMAATGSHMLAFQLRAYGALAEAFLNPDGIDPTFAIEVAEGWHAAGFESMLCNPDAHALLVAALGAPAALSPALVSRLEARRAAATEAAVRNRAKTVLSLGAAGLLDLALGRAEGQRALDEGLAHAHRYGLGGDRAVLEAAARRIRGAPTR
ncbi:MAG: hypothetical protein KC933_18415, partial [Myxococcales bacterium]|nr:hypothetical protein [Myxococcales bacterium]